jgi:hypothetical protein
LDLEAPGSYKNVYSRQSGQPKRDGLLTTVNHCPAPCVNLYDPKLTSSPDSTLLVKSNRV